MTDAGEVVLHAEALRVGRLRPLWPALSLRLRRGQTWAVVGGNGAGKSTLLRTLLGLQPACGGQVSRRGRAGYVPQRPTIPQQVPCRVRDWVEGGSEAGLSFLRLGGGRRRQAAARALERMALGPLAGRALHTLSEGQRQRVWVARALACQPAWLALDEPTGAMDAAAEADLLAEVGALCAGGEMAALWVGHHLPALLRLASHLIALDADRQVAVAGRRDAVLAQPAAAAIVARLGGGAA